MDSQLQSLAAMDGNENIDEVVCSSLANAPSSGTSRKTKRKTFQASASEMATAVLLRVFSSASQAIAKHVTDRLKECYGEQRWRLAAGENISRNMKRYLLDSQDNLTAVDIYLLTDVLLNHLEIMFAGFAVDIDEVKSRGIMLQRLVDEVDCVNKSRTALFHDVRLSVKEVERCCRCVERLWRRLKCFGLDSGAVCSLDDIHGCTKVRYAFHD